jgi:hypothetical protein
MFADVMHLEGNLFLVTVADPLNLTMQCYIENDGRMALGMALQEQLALLKSRGLIPRIVYTDPHSTFWSMTQEFPGTEIDVGGAGDYVAKVDVKIRRIKETARKVKAGLPWELPKQLIKDLITYAVSRINIPRTTALGENICPRELQLAFGGYVEAYEGTRNAMVEQSGACIALYPAANSTGSCVLWKIDTRSRVRRSNVVKLVATDAIIKVMNTITEEDGMQERNPQQRSVEQLVGRQPTEVGVGRAEEQEQDPLETQEENLISDSNEDKEAAETTEEETSEVEELGTQVVTRSDRQVTRPSRYAMVSKVVRSAWQEEAAKIAIKKELAQLIEELVAIVPVKRSSIPKGVTILKSHMVLVNKYLADGGFDKVKARLITDRRDQDPEMFQNKSSPTVAIQSVFTVLELACQKRWRIVANIDIKGAFVHTPMKGPPIYMKLDPRITQFTKEMYPEYNEFIWKDETGYKVGETDKYVL